MDYGPILNVTAAAYNSAWLERDAMPHRDMTETTLSIPQYLKDDIKALALAQAKSAGKHIPMKTYLIDLIAKEKNNRKTIDKQ